MARCKRPPSNATTFAESASAGEKQGPKTRQGLRKAVYVGVNMAFLPTVYHGLFLTQGEGEHETIRLTAKGLAMAIKAKNAALSEKTTSAFDERQMRIVNLRRELSRYKAPTKAKLRKNITLNAISVKSLLLQVPLQTLDYEPSLEKNVLPDLDSNVQYIKHAM
ncbi:hypothetical protein EDD18DRAFT_1102060 [Armillaria luteobubalina]|uniref:Uncharacterized protein n=1 Tax=Armillaria luteobubalina TaxID=153913 RepID=A0AA39QDV3_9AGAR|nr:hypothetical protein EDD18DRAFT_1102060 [Armillaria luteobubalina]